MLVCVCRTFVFWEVLLVVARGYLCGCTLIKRRKKKSDDEMTVLCQCGFLYQYGDLTIFFCDPGYK